MKTSELTIGKLSHQSKDRDIAQNILRQIDDYDWTALEMIEAPRRKRIVIESGLFLRNVIVRRDHVKNRNNWGNIQIIMTGIDSYDMTGWTTDKHGSPKEIVFQHVSVSGGQLGHMINRILEHMIHRIVFGG